jgi:hypothetical protein
MKLSFVVMSALAVLTAAQFGGKGKGKGKMGKGFPKGGKGKMGGGFPSPPPPADPAPEAAAEECMTPSYSYQKDDS